MPAWTAAEHRAARELGASLLVVAEESERWTPGSRRCWRLQLFPVPEQSSSPASDVIGVLGSIADRVRWLSTAIVDSANRGRVNDTGVKVGGHQASSASIVDVMVSLWFAVLEDSDRVSVKPHASPVLHAINYLLDDLDGDT